jgi:hypothetical protein
MDNANASIAQRVERSLRVSRRGLFVVLAIVLIAATTLVAHALRPGSLLSDWPSKAPWLIPVAAVVAFGAMSGVLTHRGRASAAEAKDVMKTVLEDEFRQANLARAQRLALIAVLLAQIPLAALSLSGLTVAAAVTVMAVTTATVGIGSLIVSFLVFDRE